MMLLKYDAIVSQRQCSTVRYHVTYMRLDAQQSLVHGRLDLLDIVCRTLSDSVSEAMGTNTQFCR
jgi:hypothetical protein